MPRLVSRADLARLRGVSRAAATKFCQGLPAEARVDDRVDLDHPKVKAWLAAGKKPPKAKADRAPTKPAKKPRSAPRAPTAPDEKAEKRRPGAPVVPRIDSESGYAEQLAEWTLHEIVTQFGTIRAFKDILEAHEKRERARKNYLDNEETEGRLISRELVSTHVFGFIDGLLRRLLNDSPKTIASRTTSLVKAGASLEEIERSIRDHISTQITPLKGKIVRALRKMSDAAPE